MDLQAYIDEIRRPKTIKKPAPENDKRRITSKENLKLAFEANKKRHERMKKIKLNLNGETDEPFNFENDNNDNNNNNNDETIKKLNSEIDELKTYINKKKQKKEEKKKMNDLINKVSNKIIEKKQNNNTEIPIYNRYINNILDN